MNETVRIMTVASCSNVRDEHRGRVVVSGSYGGRYNAFNAAKWPVRAVIMNDAGVGRDKAGIVGLEFLDRIGWPLRPRMPRPATSATATTCWRTALSATSIARPRPWPWAARPARASAPAPSGCGQPRCRPSPRPPSPRVPASSCATCRASPRWSAPIPSACCSPTMSAASS